MAYHHNPDAIRPTTGQIVAVNEAGKRMGEGHGRAKLTDHDVELIQSLIECRDALIREYAGIGFTRAQVCRTLAERQLSYRGIAEKFEISKSHVRHIANGTYRRLAAVGWKAR